MLCAKRSRIALLAGAFAAPLALQTFRPARAAVGPTHRLAPFVRPHPLGTWGAWRAVTHEEGRRLICYAYTRAVVSSPLLAGRGAVVLSVTERTGAPRDAVALNAGYTYPPGSSVELVVGRVRLALYTEARSAFARDGGSAVRAFAVADRAVSRSPAPGGRVVSDSFSLAGFAAAHAAIRQACPGAGRGTAHG